MDVLQRVVKRHQPCRLHHIGRERLGQPFVDEREGGRDDLLHGAGVEKMVLHLLGGVVHRHQSLGTIRLGHKGIDVRVCDVPLPIKERRLPEDDILLVKLVLALHKTYSLKPDQVHKTGTVCEVGHQTPAASLTEGLERGNLPFQLYVSLSIVDLMHIVDPRTVNVTVGVPA